MRRRIIITASLALLCAGTGIAAKFSSQWPEDIQRTWVGPQYWANRLQDWQVSSGRLECVAPANLAMRTVHLLDHQLAAGAGAFKLNVKTGLLDPGSNPRPNAAAGFLVGAGNGELDYRAAAVVHCWPGKGAGVFAGVTSAGQPIIHDMETGLPVPKGIAKRTPPREVTLLLSGKPLPNGRFELRVTVQDASGKQQVTTGATFPASRVAGNIALVSHPGTGKGQGARFWFRNWVGDGARLAHNPSGQFGPIVCTQYTLSRGILKLTAQMAPIGSADPRTATLEARRGDRWEAVDSSEIIVPGYTVPFRVTEWDASRDVPYRVVYTPHKGETHTWEGTVRRDPVDKETLVVAGFTGNHNNSHAIGGGWGAKGSGRKSNWLAGMWFPHADIVKHVGAHKPDVLFFSGDQVYEGKSPTFPDRANIKLDYLYKWYLWCWAYRDLTKDIVTVTIPDDHDVYQGNLWGGGGRKTDLDTKGGYVHPADFVQMSERTQTSHLPDPWFKGKLPQGIGAYYTDMVYGRIGFAVLEDRKFKSGCYGRFPGVKLSRPDHVTDMSVDVKTLDVPGLEILGKEQIKFLHHFAGDWQGQDMKMAMSQTIFANMATHHGGGLQRLRCDMDSNGWPQSARRRAIDALRRGFVFHLAGDQHLASLVHHGIDAHNDAIWSMCVPSIANFYPRAWKPEATGANRTPGMPPHLGEHVDGFENRVTVYAVTNPTQLTGGSMGHKPAELHDKMPGYGIIRLNKVRRDLTVECWPRFADPTASDAKQYEGWPRTISQFDNYNRKPAAHLPCYRAEGIDNPVIRVTNEKTGELVYAVRSKNNWYHPRVFGQGTYTVEFGEPGREMKVFKGVTPDAPGKKMTRKVVEF